MAVQYILEGEPPITVELRRNARARRLTLRVSARDGHVTLTCPTRMATKQALDFAQSKQSWLAGQVAKVAAPSALAIGDIVPIAGEPCVIETAPVRAPQLVGARILVPERRASAPGPSLAAFLKLRARDAVTAYSETYAAQVNRRFTKITLRDTSTRWGSCTSQGGLMYSWRLAMAPPRVLEYVVAHEVAHLVEMNHSAAFWAQVGALMPDYKQHRAWLKREGHTLQRIVLD